MEETIIFKIPRKIILNANISYHYHQKGQRAKKLRELAFNQLNEIEHCKFNNFNVNISIYPPTKRRFDPPNLYPTVKHLIDGMTDANYWKDDDWKHLHKMSFQAGGDISHEKDIFVFEIIITERTGD